MFIGIVRDSTKGRAVKHLEYEAYESMAVKEMQKIYYEDCVYLVAVYLKKLQAYNNTGWTGWTNVDGGIIFNFTRDNYLKVKAGK